MFDFQLQNFNTLGNNRAKIIAICYFRVQKSQSSTYQILLSLLGWFIENIININYSCM